MRTLIVGMLALLGLAASAPGQSTAPAEARRVTEDDILAADSLLRTAVDMLVDPDARGRAGRLVALAESAEHLAPDNAPVQRMLANIIYPSQNRKDAAVASAEKYLRIRPRDHEQGLIWMDMSYRRLQEADERSAWLAKIAGREDLPKALRADAAAHQARMLMHQGKPTEAEQAYASALRLDPYNAFALNDRLGLLGEFTSTDRLGAMLKMLVPSAGNPALAMAIANELQKVGLYKEALVFHEHIWALDIGRGEGAQVSVMVARAMCDALLDAGQARQAVERCQGALKRFPNDVLLRSLILEAWQILGDEAKVAEQIKQIEESFKPFLDSRVPPSVALDMAEYYLVTKPIQPLPKLQIQTAFTNALEAYKGDPKNLRTRRTLAAARIATGQGDLVRMGVTTLRTLIDTDASSAAILAQYYLANGRDRAGEAVLLDGAKSARSGAGYRKLARLAAGRVTIGRATESLAVTKLMQDFDPRYLEMAVKPEKFIDVRIIPRKEEFAPGDALEVDLFLTNISKVKLPLGSGALLKPTARVTVVVPAEGKREEVTYDDLPLVVWPAPRYLLPGHSIKYPLRLDVGKLGMFLAGCPLERVTLTLEVLIDPRQRDTKIESSVPTLKVPPTKIVRTDLMGRFDRDDRAKWHARYRRILGRIVGGMKRGNLPRRMRSARQVASLLALVRNIERGRAQAPSPMRRFFTKPVLLTMLREVLKDRSATVRAEMLAALLHVRLDRRIVSLLAPIEKDPSPLVRMRLLELLAATEAVGGEEIVKRLSADKDEMVARMAKAFRKE